MSSEESKSTVEINISSQRGIKYQGEFPPFKKKEKYLEKPFKRLINFTPVDSTTHPNGLTFCLWSDQIMSLNLILQKGDSAGLKKKIYELF